MVAHAGLSRLALVPSPRRRFLTGLRQVLGDARTIFSPTTGGIGLVGIDDSGLNLIPAHGVNTSGRFERLGHALALTYNGTDQFTRIPDTDSLSFGNGTADQAFSVVVLANVTDTAANRALACKWNATGSQREWIFYVLSTDLLQFQVRDESVGVSPVRVSDAAITQGSWALFGVTYSGVGGATAADGVALYANGAAIASTATNQATYVAMENGTGRLEIGSFSDGTSGFMSGSLALVAVCQKALSATEHAALASLCRGYFGVSL